MNIKGNNRESMAKRVLTPAEEDKKHAKYYEAYQPNELFWGIGIENETYLQSPDRKKVNKDFYLNSHKSERYSVDYYKTYLGSYFNKAIEKLLLDESLPVLINGHYLTKCDTNGEHQTLFTKAPQKPNPKFLGKTNFEALKEADSWFAKEEDNSYCFDGDTIEFMTLDFYNTTISKVIKELIDKKKTFIKKVSETNVLPKGTVFAEKNHGFAIMATNPDNLAIFNNGTYHFNFTLPTLLDENALVKDFKDFEDRHMKAIRFIQFMEPFLVAKYGSGDPLAASKIGLRYPNGSQRGAASRYMSLGTYNTSEQPLKRGKLLQMDMPKFSDDHWHTKLYKQINYSKGEKIGFDINFNKFRNHGIEIRFFDWFPEDKLSEVLTTLVYLLDLSESTKSPPSNPLNIDKWHTMLFKAIHLGSKATLDKDEINLIKNFLNIKKIRCDKPILMTCVYDQIAADLKKRFHTTGKVSKYMLRGGADISLLSRIFSAFCWCD